MRSFLVAPSDGRLDGIGSKSSVALRGLGRKDGRTDENARVTKLGAAELDSTAGRRVNQARALADSCTHERGLRRPDRAADRDRGRIERREHRCHADRQGVAGRENESDRVRVSASRQREDRRSIPWGDRTVGTAPNRPDLPSTAGKPGPSAPGLDTVAPATATARPVPVADREMADLTGSTVGTGEDPSVDDDPRPEARPERQEDERVSTPPRAGTRFTQGARVPVVVQSGGDAPESIRDHLGEWQVVPAEVRGVVDDAGHRIERTGGTDPNGHGTGARRKRLLGRSADRLDKRRGIAGRGEPNGWPERSKPLGWKAIDGGDDRLRPADIEHKEDSELVSCVPPRRRHRMFRKGIGRGSRQ